MSETTVFSAEGALVPSEPAFSDEVYQTAIHNRDTAYGLTSFSPRVICSPHLTGKTTQLNFLASRFRDVYTRIDIRFPSNSSKFTEEDLRVFLARKLDASIQSTLRGIIQSSAVLKAVGKKACILTLISVETLQDRVLRWLLAGIRGLAEVGGILEKRRVHVLVDGSFSVQTLTAGPTSDFPLPQLYPPEFSEEAQRGFVSDRLHKINISITQEAFRLLHLETTGDKYLTQILCLRLAASLGFPDTMKTVDTSEIENCVASFCTSPLVGYELGKSLGDGVQQILDILSDDDEEVVELIDNIEHRWHGLSRELRACIYKSGLVRRINVSDVVFRAPIVKKIVVKAMERLSLARQTLRLYFNLEGVVESEQHKARIVVAAIEREAILGTLKSLHVGYGRRIGESKIVGEMYALGHGEYEAEWELSLNSSDPSQEFWILLWGGEPENGVRRSELRAFPVRTGVPL